MKNFTGYNLYFYTDILFGRDTEAQTGKMIKKHGGTKVLLVYGSGSIKKTGLYDRVVKSLRDEKIPFAELGGVQPNPRRSLVEKGIKLAADEKADFLLGVGGGSVIDTAKAIALAMANNGEYWKFYTGACPQKMAPVGVINTIAAAGSETSRSSVIKDDIETGRKFGFNWDPCRPVFAIINPELTYTVGAYQTGAGSADIIAHTVSRYFFEGTPVSHIGDEFMEGLMRTVVRYAPAAIANPNDYEARAELMMTAFLSHSDIMGMGRSGNRGGEHAVEYQISGHYDTAHGAGLAAVMPAWLQYIADHGDAVQVARVAQFGTGVFGVKADISDPKGTADEGLRAFRRWVKSIGQPLTLKELGIPRGDLDAVIKRCVDHYNGILPGYMELDQKAVTEIFTSIIE
ncbi:MAG: iron-containing alcohol dehydrogenase [Treponema sp.]|nr:iron-containing alcohol dehydrogenase [Treponema sp.]